MLEIHCLSARLVWSGNVAITVVTVLTVDMVGVASVGRHVASCDQS